ncbi:hypothetical protein MNQ98_24425 [Paenibacillus sp. N3/727]|uniref:hypothetical protein n=1 Tax=Paenibacillus sp. N3/727 TaxID=2925845 RepID=UPI001F53AC46|nr:hypothetical protein [Paenibacillus sp. N3/727]UNK17571.1 hypothetical protein MNQ98_24425 [Paenibacillus sp. N3/727]
MQNIMVEGFLEVRGAFGQLKGLHPQGKIGMEWSPQNGIVQQIQSSLWYGGVV